MKFDDLVESILNENTESNPFNEIDSWFRKTYSNVKLPNGYSVVDPDRPYRPIYTAKYNRPIYSPNIQTDLAYTVGDYVYYPEDKSFIKHFAGSKTRFKTAEEVKKNIADYINGLTSMSKEEWDDALYHL